MSAAIDIIGPISLPLRTVGVTRQFSLTLYTFHSGRWVCASTGDCRDGSPVLLRVESACLFGHVFNSAQCDCAVQFTESLNRVSERGRGMVVYAIDDDARGLGIAAHFKIYRLRQQDHLDTEGVYDRLNAPVDARDYGPVADILQHQDVSSIELMSNNLARKQFFLERGFQVKTESIEVPLNKFNMGTLMLEKEDLAYDWSFRTHTDWLQPLQVKVDGSLGQHGAILVRDNREVLVERVTDTWELAREVSAMLDQSVQAADNIVAYLTDLPRRDEISIYAHLGIGLLVIPVPFIPDWLRHAGRTGEVLLQDWERKNNKYSQERPQWELLYHHPWFDLYTRGEFIRYLMLLAEEEAIRPLLAWLRQVAVSSGRPQVNGHVWFEIPIQQIMAGFQDNDPRIGILEMDAPGGGPKLKLPIPLQIQS